MSWDEARARRSNRTWIAVTAGLALVPLLLWGAVSAVPYAWTWIQWGRQVREAEAIADYGKVAKGADMDDVVKAMGEPLYSGPGFETGHETVAAVYYWDTTEGEARGIVINNRLADSLKVGEW